MENRILCEVSETWTFSLQSVKFPLDRKFCFQYFRDVYPISRYSPIDFRTECLKRYSSIATKMAIEWAYMRTSIHPHSFYKHFKTVLGFWEGLLDWLSKSCQMVHCIRDAIVESTKSMLLNNTWWLWEFLYYNVSNTSSQKLAWETIPVNFSNSKQASNSKHLVHRLTWQ